MKLRAEPSNAPWKLQKLSKKPCLGVVSGRGPKYHMDFFGVSWRPPKVLSKCTKTSMRLLGPSQIIALKNFLIFKLLWVQAMISRQPVKNFSQKLLFSVVVFIVYFQKLVLSVVLECRWGLKLSLKMKICIKCHFLGKIAQILGTNISATKRDFSKKIWQVVSVIYLTKISKNEQILRISLPGFAWFLQKIAP